MNPTEALRTVTEKIADRRAVPKPAQPAAVGDARLALQVDEAWKQNVRKKVSLFVAIARDQNHRSIRLQKVAGRDNWLNGYTVGRPHGAARAFISAARQLKGLL